MVNTESAADTPGTSSTTGTSIKRPLIISLSLAMLLVVVGWYLDALIFAPFGLLALFWQILCALVYALRRNWLWLKLCGVRMLIWIAAMAILVMVHNYYLKNTRTNAEAVVAALQTHHAREGRYPLNLEALAPRDMPVVPLSAMSPSDVRPFRYRTTAAADGKVINFTLRFFTGFRHQHIYDSETGKWSLTD